MTAPTAMPPTAMPPTDRTGPTRRWYRRPSGIATAVIVAGSFGLWTYAFSGLAAKDPPDMLADLAYRQRAEAVCAPARAFVDGLPPAPAATDPIDRSNTLAQANERLGAMVAELRSTSPSGDRDRAIVEQWLGDWDRFLRDRIDYQQVLATGRDAQFTLTLKDGENYTKSMDNLATVNDMGSCATPGDV